MKLNHEDALLAKKNLRKKVKSIVREISSAEKGRRSLFGCELLLRGQTYLESDVVFSYMALPDEVDVSVINEEAIRNKSVFALPRVIDADSGVMRFYFCDRGDRPLLLPGSYGILEPEENPEKELNLAAFRGKKVMVIVPGVAFSKDNYRMGRGKGFYDRILSFLMEKSKSYGYEIKFSGICFREQMAEDIPVEENDVRMNEVIVC